MNPARPGGDMALELDFSKLSGTDILDMAIAIEDEAQLYY